MFPPFFLKPRPWLVDDFSRWFDRIKNPADRPRCVLLFCDNSGADLILGVLPFVVECLDWGSKVILTANSGEFLILLFHLVGPVMSSCHSDFDTCAVIYPLSSLTISSSIVPAINDVTYRELLFLLNEVAGLEPRLQSALDTGMLMCIDNGQSSPCLDLRQTSHYLVELVKQEKVRLLCQPICTNIVFIIGLC